MKRHFCALLLLACVLATGIRADDVGTSDDIVRAITDADVAGESLGRALSKLAHLDEAQKHDATTLLIEATKSNLDRPRLNALVALARLGSSASSSASRIIEIIQNPQEPAKIREQATWALSRIGANGATAVPALASGLKDDDLVVRLQAASGLATFPSDTLPAAMPALVEAMKDPEPQVRIAAAQAAGHLGNEHAADVVNPMIDLLRDPQLEVRLAAIRALGGLHESASPAIEALTTVLHDSDRVTVSAAAMTLARIGQPASDSLGAMLEAGDRVDLHPAIALLKYRMGQTQQAMAELQDSAAHANDDWFLAIDEIGAETVSMLTDLLNSPRTSLTGVRALQHLGPAAKDALPALRRLQLSDANRNLSTQTLAAIQAIEK
jgi:HEAT repeat protein